MTAGSGSAGIGQHELPGASGQELSAPPSGGACPRSEYRVVVHSHTLPIMSIRPNPFAGKVPTGEVPVQRAADIGHLQFQTALRLGPQRIRRKNQRRFLPVLLQQRVGNLPPGGCIIGRTHGHVAQHTDGSFRPPAQQQRLPQQRARLVQFRVQRHSQHEIHRHIRLHDCL